MKKLKMTRKSKSFKILTLTKDFKKKFKVSEISKFNNKAIYGPIKLKLKTSINEDNKKNITIKKTLDLFFPNKKNICFKRINITDIKLICYYYFIIIINCKNIL